jgi:hypothetical protein
MVERAIRANSVHQGLLLQPLRLQGGMPTTQGGIDGRRARWRVVHGQLGHGHLGECHLQPYSGVSAPDHLQDQLDVALGVAPVTAVEALGSRKAMPGLPHPEHRG